MVTLVKASLAAFGSISLLCIANASSSSLLGTEARASQDAPSRSAQAYTWSQQTDAGRPRPVQLNYDAAKRVLDNHSLLERRNPQASCEGSFSISSTLFPIMDGCLTEEEHLVRDEAVYSSSTALVVPYLTRADDETSTNSTADLPNLWTRTTLAKDNRVTPSRWGAHFRGENGEWQVACVSGEGPNVHPGSTTWMCLDGTAVLIPTTAQFSLSCVCDPVYGVALGESARRFLADPNSPSTTGESSDDDSNGRSSDLGGVVATISNGTDSAGTPGTGVRAALRGANGVMDIDAGTTTSSTDDDSTSSTDKYGLTLPDSGSNDGVGGGTAPTSSASSIGNDGASSGGSNDGEVGGGANSSGDGIIADDDSTTTDDDSTSTSESGSSSTPDHGANGPSSSDSSSSHSNSGDSNSTVSTSSGTNGERSSDVRTGTTSTDDDSTTSTDSWSSSAGDRGITPTSASSAASPAPESTLDLAETPTPTAAVDAINEAGNGCSRAVVSLWLMTSTAMLAICASAAVALADRLR